MHKENFSRLPIQVPTEFPAILKAFTKAAIRSQPKDLLLWSAAYFRCLSMGETPPAKDRLEHQKLNSVSGLTPGLLRVLHKQLGVSVKVSTQILAIKWRGVCLSRVDLDHILLDGGWKKGEVDWIKFVSLACNGIFKSINETMQSVCEIFSENVDTSSIPVELFCHIYKYLAERNPDVSKEKVEEVLNAVEQIGISQGGYITIQNLRVSGFPGLE